MRTLETERLVLRPFVEEDLHGIHHLVYADEAVSVPFSGRVKTLEETETWLAYRIYQVRDSSFGFLAVVRRDDNQLLGLVALQTYLADFIQLEEESQQASNSLEVELSYALGQAYWRQGYATEACRELVRYAFEDLRVGRLMNAIEETNADSASLMKRLGFRLSRNYHPDYTDEIIGILDNPQGQ